MEKSEAEARKGLSGDRAKVFDRHGKPTEPEADWKTAKTWFYRSFMTSGNGPQLPCNTTVTFNGNTKVSEREKGIGCPH